eukprot:m.178056 g.178056  ORF g.178056 m.178056 type:complete len:337 (-) comp31922_c0_seq1:140-1150(-)
MLNSSEIAMLEAGKGKSKTKSKGKKASSASSSSSVTITEVIPPPGKETKKIRGIPVRNFTQQPDCPRLHSVTKASVAELKKLSKETLQTMQVELESILKFSRKRTMLAATEYSSLIKWHENNWGAERQSKRKERTASVTSPESSSTNKRRAVDVKKLERSPQSKGKEVVVAPTLVKKKSEKSLNITATKKKETKVKSSSTKASAKASTKASTKASLGKVEAPLFTPTPQVDIEIPMNPEDNFPVLPEDHEFWKNVSGFFKHITHEASSTILRPTKTNPSPEQLRVIPVKGRHYSHTWNERNFAVAVNAAKKEARQKQLQLQQQQLHLRQQQQQQQR